MNEVSITQYIVDNFAHVHPAETWGDTFFYVNPDRSQPDEVYFATLKSSDDDYDRASKLDRPEIFRLSMGISRASFHTRFGVPQSRKIGLATDQDYTALDQLLPHPVYGAMHWVCILNPSGSSFTELQPLLAEAYQLALDKVTKRAARS